MKKETENKKLSVLFDGTELETKDQLMIKMKEALSFPDYFGMNWDSLDEVLRDLSWLYETECVQITFCNPDLILSSATENDRIAFKDILDMAVEYWKPDENGLRFNVEYKG